MSTKTKVISRTTLRELLASVNHAQPVTFTALTKPSQKVNPWGNSIYKLAKVNAFIGANYLSSVNRQRKKAGLEQRSESAPHAWGDRVTPCLLAKSDKTGAEKHYLVAHIQNHERVARRALFLMPVERASMGKHREILTAVPLERVSPFIRPSKPSAETEDMDRPVVYRNYALESIVAITMGGQRYRVRDN